MKGIDIVKKLLIGARPYQIISSIMMAIIMVTLIISTPAYATSADTNLTDTTSIINRMDQLGIEKDVQSSLLEKIKNGETLDCENPQKVSQIINKLITSSDNPKCEYTFPDGSKIISETTIDSEMILFSGSTVRTVTVRNGTIFIKAEYKAQILLNSDYPKSQILQVYDPFVTVYSGSLTSIPVLKIEQSLQSGTTPAKARMTFSYEYSAVGYPLRSGIAWLDLLVRDSNYWNDFRY